MITQPSSTGFRLTNGGRLIGIEATLPVVGKVASILGSHATTDRERLGFAGIRPADESGVTA